MNKEILSEKADSIINNHVLFSIGAGLVPIPIVDLLGVTAIQIDMLAQLAKLYGVEFNRELGKSIVSALVGGSLARLGASAIKAIPGIGTIIGELSMGITAAASTYAVGHLFKAHFEEGGDLYNFDIDEAKKKYKQKYEEGKTIAAEMTKNKKLSKEDQENLKKIQELYAQEIITEEQYKDMLEKIMKK